MTTIECPYCGEAKPSDGVQAHVMLTGDGAHGGFGTMPKGFDVTNLTIGESPSSIDEDERSPSIDPLRAERSPLARVVFSVRDSVSLTTAVAGLLIVGFVAVVLNGAWAGLLGILGILTVVFSLFIYTVLWAIRTKRNANR